MVKTKETVSIEKFELSEKDKAEIKNNLPRLARFYIKENKDFVAAMDRNIAVFFRKLELKCFNEMFEGYLDYTDEDASIFDCDGFENCLDTLESMINDYICNCGRPSLTSKDFENDEDIDDYIYYKLQNSHISVEELKKNGDLDKFLSVISKL